MGLRKNIYPNENLLNQFGLSRKIPPDVKRAIRTRCGFGCVVCGNAIITYHHFNPEYHEAKKHLSEGITLLCAHCHIKVSKRIFDFDFISKSNENPKCKQVGFTGDIFYVGNKPITFKLGGAGFRECGILFFNNEPIICFYPPENDNGPLRLNATLYDSNENSLLKIKDNEWMAGIDHFDIETNSNELIIRNKIRSIKLRLTSVAEKEISILQMDMAYRGYKIEINNGEFVLKSGKIGRFQLTCPNIFGTLFLDSKGGIKMAKAFYCH
jgi:hypothetical protein